MRIEIMVIVSLLLSSHLYAQSVPKELTYIDFIQLVKEHHPVMFQAELLDDRAENTERMARGGFDPKLDADWNHKSFDDKNYYSLANGALKIPTWFGVDLKTGYERNNGQFLNDSDEVPRRGLWYAGISIPLGKGLVIDERRASLKRAEIFRKSTKQEQLLLLNKLMFEASEAYLNWQADHAYLQIAQEGVRLAEQRFEGTKSSYDNGDKPAIDTLESYISIQTRQMDLQKAIQKLSNTEIIIENFLWLEGITPLELGDDTQPELIDIDFLKYKTDSLSVLQGELILTHPEIVLYDTKLDNINLDLRLAKEDLKPDIRVNYNPLISTSEDRLFEQFEPTDYKLGASLSYPILQRKQRGKIELTKIKSESTTYDRSLKTQDIKIKLETYLNNIEQMLSQFELQSATVVNYNNMLIAENKKFEAGESSVFLVNSRERKYLESQYKQVGINQKLLSNRLKYIYSIVAYLDV